MRVLLVGSGARENALGWALARSSRVDEIICLPGNPGLAELGPAIDGIDPTDAGAVAAVARVHDVDLVMVGPEAPLAAGVADAVRRLGIPAFGPSRAGARLEGSKAFAKEIMARAGVPTGKGHVFETQAEAAEHIRSSEGPYVVKADGLAAGKGVLVTEDRAAALAWVERCFSGGFGDAGSTVVVEEYLAGPELSVFGVCDGTAAVTLDPARDYKRLTNGDTGPNTGGMGSFSPVDLPDSLVEQVRTEIIDPVLTTMADDGDPYIGFLYAGLALTGSGPKVIEFNVRLGDPETQAVLPRLESDLVDLIEAALGGAVTKHPPRWSPRSAVNVVLAAEGYPETPHKGDVISGVGAAMSRPDVLVFHAGTAIDEGGRLVTNGGRVLSVVGLGDDLASARDTAYAAADLISWPGRQMRTDIAG